MVVPRTLLRKYGGMLLHLRKGDSVFREGEPASYFYQVEEGIVKVISASQDGREFIQGVFCKGESFGEPPVFCCFPYPATAICREPSTIYRLEKACFFALLRDHPDVHLKVTAMLCERLRYKNMMLTEVAFYQPEHRLEKLFAYIAHRAGPAGGQIVIPYTRQELADLTGMRVETAIRSIKKLELNGRLVLDGRKIIVKSRV